LACALLELIFASSRKKWESLIKTIQKILLVDDEPEFLRSLHRFLKREPFSLVTANQGVEAKALIEKAALNHDPFDLVITDLIMPKVDGWQLVQWIQRHHPEILTIILTGVGENGLARKSLRPEVDLYLEKAITPKALRDTISQLDKVKQKKTERNPA